VTLQGDRFRSRASSQQHSRGHAADTRAGGASRCRYRARQGDRRPRQSDPFPRKGSRDELRDATGATELPALKLPDGTERSREARRASCSEPAQRRRDRGQGRDDDVSPQRARRAGDEQPHFSPPCVLIRSPPIGRAIFTTRGNSPICCSSVTSRAPPNRLPCHARQRSGGCHPAPGFIAARLIVAGVRPWPEPVSLDGLVGDYRHRFGY
jgi:hypothetical protein